MQAQTTAPRLPGEAAAVASPAGKQAGSKKSAQGSGGISRHEASGGVKKPKGIEDPAQAAKAEKPEALFALVLARASLGEGEAIPQKGKEKSSSSKIAGLALKTKAGGMAKGTALAMAQSSQPGASSFAAAHAAHEGGEKAEKAAILDPKLPEIEALIASSGIKPDLAEAAKPSTDSEAKAKEEGMAREAAKGHKTEARKHGHEADVAMSGLASTVLSAQAVSNKPVASTGEASALEAKGEKKEGQAPELSVLDLRKKESKKTERGSAESGLQATDAKAPAAVGRTEELDLDLGQVNSIGSGSGGREGFGQEAKAETLKPAREFSQLLAERLQESWNGDIVKSAQVVLRDGDSGTIRLRLHPDNLGGVKIELQLADNSISGRIVVESDAAKSAFERNMSQLQDAFRQNGFESARLDVQVGGGNAGASGGQAGADGSDKPFWSERRGLDSLAQAVPEAAGARYAAKGPGGVNLFA